MLDPPAPGGEGRPRTGARPVAFTIHRVPSRAVIETDQLTKRYPGGARGIEEVTLTVERGEVFGFLGPNGAGKTTTIRTLLGFLRPTSGSARLFGLDSVRDAVAAHALLGCLLGEFRFDDELTGEQVLRLFARLRGVEDLSPARELAERFEADLGRPLRELSRGNRQKIGLIQALFHRPPLLILDEPTSGLDPLMQEEFLAAIRERRAEGATVFLSSHNLAEVERACDRVGIIRDGRLAAVEPVRVLTERSFRHVTFTFGEPVEPAAFAALPGVSQLEADGRRVKFRLSGHADPVIKEAARHRVLDVEIEHPTLEEAFLAYYGDGGYGDGGALA
ncbi:MAG: ABC transporter ATP-binding protein [Thermoleophilaceae bacterium]|nr:ABC transporter ATP-binding protein [Thermoleophilaceae bacterium]